MATTLGCQGDLIYKLYVELVGEDLLEITDAFDEHTVWITPGRSRVSGEFRGRDDVLRHLYELEDVFEVIVNDIIKAADRAVAFATWNVERGAPLEVIEVIRLDRDKKPPRIREVRVFVEDVYRLDELL
jgi:ketosteroid isomerase-like protein